MNDFFTPSICNLFFSSPHFFSSFPARESHRHHQHFIAASKQLRWAREMGKCSVKKVSRGRKIWIVKWDNQTLLSPRQQLLFFCILAQKKIGEGKWGNDNFSTFYVSPLSDDAICFVIIFILAHKSFIKLENCDEIKFMLLFRNFFNSRTEFSELTLPFSSLQIIARNFQPHFTLRLESFTVRERERKRGYINAKVSKLNFHNLHSTPIIVTVLCCSFKEFMKRHILWRIK